MVARFGGEAEGEGHGQVSEEAKGRAEAERAALWEGQKASRAGVMGTRAVGVDGSGGRQGRLPGGGWDSV